MVKAAVETVSKTVDVGAVLGSVVSASWIAPRNTLPQPGETEDDESLGMST